MPIKKSAAKALRVSEKARKRHKIRKARIKFLRRNFLKSIENKDKKEAQSVYNKIQKAIDKAAQGNALKQNTAARKKSRLMKRLNSIK